MLPPPCFIGVPTVVVPVEEVDGVVEDDDVQVLRERVPDEAALEAVALAMCGGGWGRGG